MELKLLSAFNSAGEGGIVGVFQLGAEGEPVGKAGYPDTDGGYDVVEVEGGLLAFKIGVSSQDDFLYGTFLQSVGKLPDSDVVGADPFGW